MTSLDQTDTRDLTAQRFAKMRPYGGDAAPPVHVTPITRDEEIARAWFERFEGAGLDGLIAKRPDLLYEPGKRVMTKIKHVRTADCVVHIGRRSIERDLHRPAAAQPHPGRRGRPRPRPGSRCGPWTSTAS